MRRRHFLASCISLLASIPFAGKLFASKGWRVETTRIEIPVDKVAAICDRPALARLKKSVEFHRHMTLPAVNSQQQAREYYLGLMQREKAAEWSGAEITYGNGSSRKDEWAHTFGQGEPAPEDHRLNYVMARADIPMQPGIIAHAGDYQALAKAKETP